MEYIRKNEKLFIFLGVLFVLIFELSTLTITFAPKALSKNVEDIQYRERIIYRDPITVQDLLNDYQSKFNQESLYGIDLEYLTILDDVYYIGLFQDIILYIVPIKMSGDIKNDVALQSGIIFDKETMNYNLGTKYYKKMIEVNNQFILDIDFLLEMINTTEIVDQNNGLLLGKIENDCEINYVIERKYVY